MFSDARWFVTVLAALMPAACNSSDPGADPQGDAAANISATAAPAPGCPLPDDAEGQPCSCPGTSICPNNDQNIWFTCLEGGTWEKTDASCVLAGDSAAASSTP